MDELALVRSCKWGLAALLSIIFVTPALAQQVCMLNQNGSAPAMALIAVPPGCDSRAAAGEQCTPTAAIEAANLRSNRNGIQLTLAPIALTNDPTSIAHPVAIEDEISGDAASSPIELAV